MPIIKDEAWNGLDWGDLNGKTIDEQRKLYPYLRPEFMDFDETFPNGESPKIFQERVVKAWNDLLKKYEHENKNILICTHGINMIVLREYLQDRSWNNHDRRNFVPCTLLIVDTRAKKINRHLVTKQIQEK